MKIDLHCHTKAVKKGDGVGRNVTPDLFKTKIVDADVKIVAITNHNKFDYKQYKMLSSEVEGLCQVWPGVEIDVLEPESKRWHLIVVSNPKEAKEFSKNVEQLFKEDDLEECTHTIDDIYEAFKERDVIYISHFHQKRPAVPEEDGEKLNRLVGDPYRIFKETANENSMSVFANYRYNVLVGSDVKDWTHYEDCSFSELKLPVDSFEQFCLLAKRDENVVQTLLNKKESKTLFAYPAQKVSIQVQLYADMNIIFGQKGTGKTQIIKTLCDSMKSNGLRCVRYIATEREENFKSLLGINGVGVDLNKMKVESCEEDFKIISDWIDENPTHFGNYINWRKTEGNNANKSRMRITSASELVREERENEELHKEHKINIDNIYDDFCKITLEEYLDEGERNLLVELLKKLKSNIYETRLEDLIDEQAAYLVNYSINIIKGVADKSTNSVSKPSSTGFAKFVDRRLQLFKAVKSILDNLSVDETNETEKIGFLDEKGEILINTKFRMLCDESKTDEFKTGIRKLRDIKEKLEYIYNNIFDINISDSLQQLNEILVDQNIKDITSFIGCSKQVINEKGEKYSPSNGEKGILLLQMALKEEADAYFLDEPELGMGNSYIDSSIRPLLIDLSKRHKYVVVATHNANIAVRTLPYMSIYRTHSNGKYSTYIGNPFSDRLVNICDNKDVLNWAEESLKSLEGSKDAFYERKDIYESNNS